jgi:1-deoxy-D-xylulose-5-phosphate synthase
MEYKYLSRVNTPDDLKKLRLNELRPLIDEIRDFLIDTISKVGGHLGASLGVAELTVALHYVFNTPEDKLIWDVGHQAYIHKILTGRKDKLITIKQKGGISGFLKRSESEYDAFGAGHASTSLSAALGIAAGRDFQGKNFKVISIIGDGAMTGGMAYEAMNNIGMLKKDILVILNDNKMSIGPNVWTLHNYFNEFLAHPSYNKFRNYVWRATGKLDKKLGDRIRFIASKLEGGIKGIITPGMMFEALGFRYFGPVNGHNIVKMVKILEEIKDIKGPLLLHVVSEKGKGYKPAESHVQRLHASTPFDKITGEAFKKSGGTPSFTKIFGDAMVEICKSNDKVVGITAAMPDGTGLDILQEVMPDRFFDVGIAEQHAVTFAAGLATEGFTPVVAVYSSFLQRAFDQIIHDVALQHLPVIFVMDRAGLVGADGPTHHGVLDLSYFRCIQGAVIMAPKDETELRNMLYTATLYKKGPVAIRYPRGNSYGLDLKPFEKIEIGKGEIIESGKDVAILAVGTMSKMAMDARKELALEGIDVEVVNIRFVKPLDGQLLTDVFNRYTKVLTIEDNSIVGGFGSAVLEFMNQKNIHHVDVLVHGLPDKFVEHATPEQLYENLRMNGKGLSSVIRDFLVFNNVKKQDTLN